MPVEDCTLDDRPGRRWGAEGKCYPYTAGDEASRNAATKLAVAQGIAAGEIDVSKNAEEVDVRTFMPICKIDTRQRVFTAIVLEPWNGDPATAKESADFDKDVATAEEIEKDCFQFMAAFNAGTHLGFMHDEGADPDLRLYENWIAKTDLEYEQPDGTIEKVRKGTWLMTIFVVSADKWARVESGELDGRCRG